MDLNLRSTAALERSASSVAFDLIRVGSRRGVFVGAFVSDMVLLVIPHLGDIDSLIPSGNSRDVLRKVDCSKEDGSKHGARKPAREGLGNEQRKGDIQTKQ